MEKFVVHRLLQHEFDNTVYRFYKTFIKFSGKVNWNFYKFIEQEVGNIIEESFKSNIIPYKLHYKLSDLTIDIVGHNYFSLMYTGKEQVVGHFYGTYSINNNYTKEEFYKLVSSKMNLTNSKEELNNFLYNTFLYKQLLKNSIK